MSTVISEHDVTVLLGDVREQLATLPDGSVQSIVTSPPYWNLRDYGDPRQIGKEPTPGEYIATLTSVFREARRALRSDGSLWLNLGDSYAGSWGAQGKSSQNAGMHAAVLNAHGYLRKESGTGTRREGMPPAKNLLLMPARVALALQEDGWIIRSDVIWAKPSAMPESVTDRPTSAHEHVFLLTKSPRYYYDADAIAETATGRASGNGYARPESINRGGVGQSAKWEGRPQLRRALEIAREHGLTEEHFAAIRAVGMNDAGKAVTTQSGAGRNSAAMQALANEAKEALGGYYREFLTGATRNARNVWTIGPEPFKAAHFAIWPSAIPRRCILAGCPAGGTVLDPFAGSGTTLMVARQLGRKSIGIELSPDYIDIIRDRIGQTPLNFGEASA